MTPIATAADTTSLHQRLEPPVPALSPRFDSPAGVGHRRGGQLKDTALPVRDTSAEPVTSRPNTCGSASRRHGSSASISRNTPVCDADAGASAVSVNHNNFRNVSACSRCRVRKGKCDQRLPCCEGCEKANVPCVGYDPITKTEIPRRWATIAIWRHWSWTNSTIQLCVLP